MGSMVKGTFEIPNDFPAFTRYLAKPSFIGGGLKPPENAVAPDRNSLPGLGRPLAISGRKLILCFFGIWLLFCFGRASAARADIFDWQARGWLQGSLYLPRGEYCPSGGITYDEQVEARYGLDINIEFGPLDFDRLFFFADPSLYFGDNLPAENDYNLRANPMVMNWVYGLGLVLSKKHNIQARLTHGEWFDLGGYEGEQKLWNAIQLRWLFDREWIRGWTEGSFYPPHNEFGPNAGVPFEDQSVARYGLELNVEIHPEIFKGFFLFTDSAAYFGDSRPQNDYNYKTNPLVMNFKAGVGYRISGTPDLQIRLTHGQWVDLGRYEGQKFDWDALQLRWSFDRSRTLQ